ncbi:hypothetical protein, conserved [Angomonas deanei]|uniref:Uncharacterized protein n=1 Tax=Angomonas deanei TaxID=59799 RepID=A0A7G2C0U6_9TRYP|nr:hypothetical protein, conserved [Angomonas deanei]CAD2212946.1 hypothetical protein, conserved [Angomonas deanei]
MSRRLLLKLLSVVALLSLGASAACKDPNCSSCPDADNDCRSCNAGYINGQGYGEGEWMCFSPLPNCFTYNSNRRCHSCNGGYTQFNGDCVACPGGCSLCEIANVCKVCSEADRVLNNDASACVTCNVPNCVTCSKDEKCYQCAQGYYNLNGACIPCNIVGCNECKVANICSKCADAKSVPTLDGKQCVTAVSNCEVYGDGGCSKCKSGYSLSGNQCVSCPIANCNMCSKPGQCDSCNAVNSVKQETSEDGKACVANIYKCTKYSSSGACTECVTGYTSDATGKKCVECSVDGCGRCDERNVCAACKDKYTLSSENKCIPGCDVENCFSCVTPNQCSACRSGFALSSVTKACVTCTDPKCKVCNADTPDVCMTFFTDAEMGKTTLKWWVWLLVAIGAAGVVALIIALILWCCRSPSMIEVEYEENYYEEGKSQGSSSRSGSSRGSSSQGSSESDSMTDGGSSSHSSGSSRSSRSSRSSGSSSRRG